MIKNINILIVKWFFLYTGVKVPLPFYHQILIFYVFHWYVPTEVCFRVKDTK